MIVYIRNFLQAVLKITPFTKRALLSVLLVIVGLIFFIRPSQAASPTIWHDVATTMGGVTVTADIASPTTYCTPISPCPVIIMVHGGQWWRGTKEAWTTDLQRFTGMKGFPYQWVSMAVNYRLACNPAHPPSGVSASLCGYQYPVAKMDVQAWVDWAQQNIINYGGDPTRIMMLGSSAGAQIAEDLASTGHGIRAVGAWSAPSEFNPTSCGGWCSVITGYLGCSYGVCPNTWSSASSTNQVSTTTVPIYVANSTNETIGLDIAQRFVDALNAHGVTNTFTVLQGTLHAQSYQGVHLPNGKTVLNDTADWMISHLQPIPTPTPTP